ncbi:helix-turn-helix domain-containing protein [Georgenia sp. EYE_87]|uniref:arsenate reductase/protein-tyrosine-phosphatase family protein n=1 Tax=Georgenia sp. EYE_87 TaxID=2853448 RepID=UPI0020057E59|nr:ArsR family transcriptional regulator [Georgenia sp. EYE_87]MCK6210200.1 helix-turn-helix domain-containing protein [Georgenia sp. EYE_87]
MNIERTTDPRRGQQLARRAALHAALADPARLQIVDTLNLGDASPSELAEAIGMPSNLLAHHLKVLEREGIVGRTRSEGDRRRSYVHLVPGALADLTAGQVRQVPRVLFVCTANSARSHLATALWRQTSEIPAVSAGTHPAEEIAPGAVESARRHHLELAQRRPQHVDGVRAEGDLVITVCDRAHEELDFPVDVHWSIPDPILAGTPEAFDRALEEIGRRVGNLAPRLSLPTNPIDVAPPATR